MPTETLSDFLRKVSDTLQVAIDSRGILFREELREDIHTVWENTVRGLLNSYLDRVQTAENKNRDALEDHGLVEDQLKMKLAGFDLAFEAFQKGGTVRLLRRLLNWINSILDSLADAIPGGGAIKEFKEVIENGIED